MHLVKKKAICFLETLVGFWHSEWALKRGKNGHTKSVCWPKLWCFINLFPKNDPRNYTYICITPHWLFKFLVLTECNMFGPKLFGSSNPANVRARIHILEGILEAQCEMSRIIMNHLRFTIKCMAHLNNQYACEVSKLPWNMANVFFGTWNDFRFHCCFIPEVFRPWWTVVKTKDSGGAQNPGAACEGGPASQAHSLLWLMNKHQMKCIYHKSTDLPVPKCRILNSMKFYPKQWFFIANNDSPMSVFQFHQNLGLQHEMTH